MRRAAPAMLEAAAAIGIPRFADHNGAMMEGPGGCALANLCVRDGRRVSIFRSYLYPWMDRPNLTVLTGALVTRVVFDGARAAAVEVLAGEGPRRFAARGEIILSLGAVQTPKVLMQSGVGDREELGRFDIEVVRHLPGVGRNFQDHLLFAGCAWEYERPQPIRNNGGEATFFWKSDPSLETPDLQSCQEERIYLSPETARLAPPADGWSMAPGLVRPQSRGRLRLTGPGPSDPLGMDSRFLSDPADFTALMACVRISREIGNSPALRPFTKRELLPGARQGAEFEHFARDAVTSYTHQSCTAKMGRDPLSVVDGELKVYGVDALRIADASVMPRVTTGNTMAPDSYRDSRRVAEGDLGGPWERHFSETSTKL
jgi:choline dehydrogenase